MDDFGEDIGRNIVDASIKVHTVLGPGLLENAYETCMVHELSKRQIEIRRQVPLSVEYDGVAIDLGYRLDLLVANSVVIELKAVEKLLPLHLSQVLTYLKLGNYRLGFLLNFNVRHMREGIKRVVL
ncbi:MAG: GxxExxY protein [Gammaproteobacteria bacterium]|nr:GxxExxY protein [Gammaproteobacteria bacterium]